MLFICRMAGAPGPHPEIGATLITLESPDGPVAQAFESEELARLIWTFYGAADSVFLLPEEKLTPELKLQLLTLPVVVYRTGRDYDGATLNEAQFPWLDRVIRYAAFPLALLLSICLPGPLRAQSPFVQGSVFVDHNRNTRRDPGEPGLANVTVSNQDAVVASTS